MIWAKGQWAPFLQEPLAKNTQGVCARPGLEVPAARGLAAPLDWAAAGGGAGGLAGPGAVVEGDVTPLGPAGGGLAVVLAASVAGGPVATAFCAAGAAAAPGTRVVVAGVSASAAIIAPRLAPANPGTSKLSFH